MYKKGNFIVYLIVFAMGIVATLVLFGPLTKTGFWPDYAKLHVPIEQVTTAPEPPGLQDSITLGATSAARASSAADPIIGNTQSVAASKAGPTTTETMVAPDDSQQFADEVNQELNRGAGPGGWSADTFIESLNQSASQAEATVTSKVASDIRDATRSDAVRQQNNVLYDPYLFNITQEARDLSVTSVEEATKSNLIRNLPASNGASDSRYKIVTVQRGETLSSIAQREYGDPAAYPIIFYANQDILGNANELIEGQNLRIPDR